MAAKRCVTKAGVIYTHPLPHENRNFIYELQKMFLIIGSIVNRHVALSGSQFFCSCALPIANYAIREIRALNSCHL